MAKSERLGVWLDGIRVADLERRHWNEIRCRYTAEALDLWPGNSPVISCSLPVTERPLDAAPFCMGLLPEGKALDALAREAGVATRDAFGLLRRFGRDVAGALVISEDPPEVRKPDVEPYSEESLARAVEEVEAFPLGVHDDSELSLAGLQDKLLLVRTDGGGWGRPLHGRPSTHLLKIDDPLRSGLVVAEAHCLRLAKAVGLTDIEIELDEFAGRSCLIVSRFDRVIGSDGLRRVHQEDLCQALGVDPGLQRGRAKYERAGGPGFERAAE
ncbi:MAG TPA: HipA domain-containing protein, partial [Thermoleophilia bacterium]|nr:HipA domain-containing protein [Thermoleophilia bacterium]